MSTALEYFRRAKVDELEAKFRSEGFEVSLESRWNGVVFDLVAEKQGYKVAIDVEVQSMLRGPADKTAKHLKAARELGFEEFKVVVVIPPRETKVEFHGFEAALLEYVRRNPPPELTTTPPIDFQHIEQIDFDRVLVQDKETDLAGDGVILVGAPFQPGTAGSATVVEVGLPLRFDVTLGPEMRIAKVRRLEIDHSSIADLLSSDSPA